MTPDQIREFVENALRSPTNFPWLAYLVVFAIAWIGGWLGSYLRAKGENRAKREDIAELTKLVEQVRTEHAQKLESLVHSNRRALEYGSREHQLRLAALEKRLEAHQEAYHLCRKMVSAVHSERNNAVVTQCQEWWNRNCLYLDAESRIAFWRAFRATSLHPGLLQSRADSKLISANWEKIISAEEVIERGAALPEIAGLSREEFNSDGTRRDRSIE